MTKAANAKWVLPCIVISQFLCTSLWFAGNGILPDLIKAFDLNPAFVADLTSAVQLGFISGTLVFAILAIADRFSPVKVFFICAIIAAACNLGVTIQGITPFLLLLFRFLTGFFLAGIYPVGMKIAADHFEKGLGKSLGFLVGALVFGTSFPHLLRSLSADFSWKLVIMAISILCVLGGLIMLLFVADGPFRKPGQRIQLSAFLASFRIPEFRAAAFGYFGHMWELYTYWAFVPVILAANNELHHTDLNVPLFSFIIIAVGGLSCFTAGLLSQYFKPKQIATLALFLSGFACLLSPLILLAGSSSLLIAFMIFWGLMATADSPMFSTVVASSAPPASRGASLTVVNCIGFAITIVSIQFLKWMSAYIDSHYLYLLLAIGPIAGLAALRKNKTSA